MSATIRDAPIGQVIRWITRNGVLQYPEEKADFALPAAWLEMMNPGQGAGRQSATGMHDEEKVEQDASGSDSARDRMGESAQDTERTTTNGQRLNLQRTRSRQDTLGFTRDRLEVDEMHEVEKTKSTAVVPRKTQGGTIVVDWYYSDDAENPQNWSNLRRICITGLICVYTFVVYMSSAIYTNSIEGIMEEFGVDSVKGSLGLSLFVLGYGIGPLLFSPLSEIAQVGRNPVYVTTMFLFVIMSIPTAVVGNYPGLMVLRFLQGFFGSPCLASGGASVGDMYSFMSLPYALSAWVSAAYCGPALGPLISGFAVPVLGWRWSLLEIIWASMPVLVLMFLFLPETAAKTVLLRRAQRLRKRMGDGRFMAQSELDGRDVKTSAMVADALIKPLEITLKDPAVLFVQVYTAIIYSIYYSFFEVFPLVYPVYYGMNPGQVGLVFLCVAVACVLGFVSYVAYIYYYVNPRIRAKGLGVPENRLLPALPCSFGPTIGLFIFAWTAAPQFPWIAPTIGITVYASTVFIVMQVIFLYIPLSYPQYAASLFAANDFTRSSLACCSIIYAHPLFGNLGVARGTSLLGGLSTIGILGIWALYYKGAKLRSMSKFAEQ